MKEFSLNSLHYSSLPGYSYDCWLMTSDVSLDTIQYEQMLDRFIKANRIGICCIKCDIYNNINSNHNNSKINNSNGNKNNMSIGETWTTSHNNHNCNMNNKNIENSETWTKSHNNSNSKNNSINNNNNINKRNIRYIDAINLYGRAMMQKKAFKITTRSHKIILHTR